MRALAVATLALFLAAPAASVAATSAQGSSHFSELLRELREREKAKAKGPGSGAAGAPAGATTTSTPATSTPTTTYVPSGGAAAPGATATTPPAATTTAPPATTATPGASTVPPVATTPSTATPASKAKTASDRPLSAGAIVIAALAALLVLACVAWAFARSRAVEPHWLVTLRHSFAEAGFRASATWSELLDWARLGR